MFYYDGTKIRYGGMTPVTRVLLYAIGGMYLGQLALGAQFKEGLEFNWKNVLEGKVWQRVSYMFLHDSKNIFHLLMNGFLLFLVGPEVERRLGGRLFLGLFLVCGVAGALGHAVLFPSHHLIGASAGVVASWPPLFCLSLARKFGSGFRPSFYHSGQLGLFFSASNCCCSPRRYPGYVTVRLPTMPTSLVCSPPTCI